jgi:hypothetical protein
MASETAAKKLKTSGPLIGTHKYVLQIPHIVLADNITPLQKRKKKTNSLIAATSMPTKLSLCIFSVCFPNTMPLLWCARVPQHA